MAVKDQRTLEDIEDAARRKMALPRVAEGLPGVAKKGHPLQLWANERPRQDNAVVIKTDIPFWRLRYRLWELRQEAEEQLHETIRQERRRLVTSSVDVLDEFDRYALNFRAYLRQNNPFYSG